MTETRRRTALLLVCSLVLLLCFSARPSAVAAEPKKKAPEEKKRMITAELRKAVKGGLDYIALAVLKSADGSVSSSYPVAVTSLVGLAFLANGESPTRGPHAEALKKCLDYIVSHTNLNTGGVGAGLRGREMHAHGFAALFLAEAYGTVRSVRLRRALRATIRLIERSQGPQGGWGYTPNSGNRAENSVTVCEVMALRAARNAGLAVSAKTVERGIAYVLMTSHPNGGFRYAYPHAMGQPRVPITAGTLCVLYALGVYRAPADSKFPSKLHKKAAATIEPALKFLQNTRHQGLADLRRNPKRIPGGGHGYYTSYYLAQALAFAGPKYWNKWYPRLRDAVLERRGRNTYWTGEVDNYYATALSCITLSVPFQFLPIFDY